MLYLIIMMIGTDRLFTLEQTLDQLAVDHITCAHIEQIEKLYLGQYLMLGNKYVVVRIQ